MHVAAHFNRAGFVSVLLDDSRLNVHKSTGVRAGGEGGDLSLSLSRFPSLYVLRQPLPGPSNGLNAYRLAKAHADGAAAAKLRADPRVSTGTGSRGVDASYT